MVVSAAFVVAGRYRSEVFEPVYAALDNVATFVGLLITSRWPSAFGTLGEPVLFSILAVRTDAADAPASQHLALFVEAVGTVESESWGRLRGRPRPKRGTRNSSSTCSNQAASLHCPAVTTRDSGRTLPSAHT